METISEFPPTSARISQVRPQYPSDDRQLQLYQAPRQAWSQESSQTPFIGNQPKPEPETNSCKKHLTLKLAASIFVGLVICGIPLAVVSSLYAQKKATPSSSGSGSSGSASSGSSDSSSSLPSQCLNYIVNSDPTRLTTYTGCTNCIYDTSPSLATGWYRFIEGAGTRLATIPPSTGACGVSYPGYYNGTFPTTIGSTTIGTVCAQVNGNLCSTSYFVAGVSVTLCNGYYVFYLTSMTTTAARYCTTS